MSLLMDMPLRDFTNLLASSAPAPGGGSASALAGLLGCALSIMVVRLSVGKKSYESLDDDIKNRMEIDLQAIETLSGQLTELVDDDARAFTSYMNSLQLPRENEADKLKRAASIKKASLTSLQIPLLTAEKCLVILQHQKNIARYGNKNAVSDIGVGSLLAFAGLEGAALNVAINLDNIDDKAVVSDARRKIEDYLAHGEIIKTEIMDIVKQRMAE